MASLNTLLNTKPDLIRTSFAFPPSNLNSSVCTRRRIFCPVNFEREFPADRRPTDLLEVPGGDVARDAGGVGGVAEAAQLAAHAPDPHQDARVADDGRHDGQDAHQRRQQHPAPSGKAEVAEVSPAERMEKATRAAKGPYELNSGKWDTIGPCYWRTNENFRNVPKLANAKAYICKLAEVTCLSITRDSFFQESLVRQLPHRTNSRSCARTTPILRSPMTNCIN